MDCNSHWKEDLNCWNGKALEMILQSQLRECNITLIWTAFTILQKENGYLCKQQKAQLDLKCILLEHIHPHFRRLFSVQAVISWLSTSLNIGSRNYVRVKFYFFHHIRPPDI